MKLVIQIPCYNEEETLPETLRDIPRQIEGVDVVELLVVDDGSTDRTAEVARELGVDHVVRHRRNRGLAQAFQTALSASLHRGADIIVNTDGDNQYDGRDIAALVQPILTGAADVTIGDRRPLQIAHFSWTKKLLHRVGGAFVRRLAHSEVPDVVSGFRAITREAALQLNILSRFSYTLEMLIEADIKRLQVVSVPIRTNPKLRESRLHRGLLNFVGRSAGTILRMYTMYRPRRLFFTLALASLVVGLIPIARWLTFFVWGSGAGHLQSLVLGGAMVVVGVVFFIGGLVADLVNFNRRLLEMTLSRVQQLELELDREREDRR